MKFGSKVYSLPRQVIFTIFVGFIIANIALQDYTHYALVLKRELAKTPTCISTSLPYTLSVNKTICYLGGLEYIQ